LLRSIHRSSGRRTGGAVTLALALSLLPLGSVATAAPAPSSTPAPVPPPPPPSSPEPAPVASTEPASSQRLEAELPIRVSGSLSKEARRTLADRLQAATAAAEAAGPYRVRLALAVPKKKKDYALTLTVLGADEATLAELTDTCRACSIADVGARIDALVQQADATLAAQQPAPPAGPVAVAVSSEPLGARVRVDGTEQGFTPHTLALSPGEHTIALDKPGFVVHEQTITVEPGVELQLAIPLTAQPAAAADDKGKRRGSADPKAGRGLKIGGAVLLSLGVAGVATGVAMILIDEDPMPQRCSGTDVDFRGVCRYRYDTLLGGIVGVAAGGVGVAGGLAMLIKGHQIAVRGRADKQQASLSVTVRF
jgi:hypothetical protein